MANQLDNTVQRLKAERLAAERSAYARWEKLLAGEMFDELHAMVIEMGPYGAMHRLIAMEIITADNAAGESLALAIDHIARRQRGQHAETN